MPKMVATQNVSVGDDQYKAGDVFEVNDENAKWLEANGFAVPSKGVTAAPVESWGKKEKK